MKCRKACSAYLASPLLSVKRALTTIGARPRMCSCDDRSSTSMSGMQSCPDKQVVIAKGPRKTRRNALSSRGQPSLRHYIVTGSLGNFKSEPLGSVKKRCLTTGTKTVVQFDHDRISSVHPIQVTSLENFFLRALDVELEKINLLKTVFTYDLRDSQPPDCRAFPVRGFDSKAPRVILRVCDDDSFLPMPHRRVNSADALMVPRVPQEQLIVARIGLYRCDIRSRKGCCEVEG